MGEKVTVRIDGLNLIRIIDKLIASGVMVENLKMKTKFVVFTISKDKLSALNKICKREHKFYKIIYKSGLKQIIFKLPYYFSILLVIFISTLYFYFSSLYIFDIRVLVDSKKEYNSLKIVKILNDNGICVGANKNKFSAREIHNLIMISAEDVEDCTVEFTGQKLNIVIFPAEIKSEIQSGDIVSKYDAVIESAESYAGKLLVKSGDIVKVGDVLIQNDGGASGNVTGKVYFSATKIYNENQQKMELTGNVFEIRDYLIFEKIIAKDRKICDFKVYNVEKCDFFINKNLFIPIKCEVTKYYETRIVDEVVPFSSVSEKVKSEAYIEAKSKILDESTISNVTYSVVSDGNYTRVDCFIEAIVSLIW